MWLLLLDVWLVREWQRKKDLKKIIKTVSSLSYTVSGTSWRPRTLLIII